MRLISLLVPIFMMATLLITAQQGTVADLTIAQAVDDAVGHYPSTTVSQEQVNAAAEAVKLARTAYLPRVDSVVQVNRATRNNVFGLLLPQSVIPSISGPVLGTNSLESVWGSAAGALVTWEPFDFGLRSAGVSAAAAAKARSEATLQRTRFDVAVAAADAYLTLVAAQQTERAVQAGVDRAQVLVRSVAAQVDAQLRPGVDASRSAAELAVAQAQLARAHQSEEIARALLAQFAGVEPRQINTVSPKLLQLPPEQTPAVFDASHHPLAAEQSAAVEQRKAELRTISKSYAPHFTTQASLFVRGSGAQTDGSRLTGINGLAPETKNYALGFSVTFPLFDLPSIRAREAAQLAKVRAETAQSDQVSTELKARWNVAVATLEGARRVAGYTPAQVTAANDANQQAAARDQAGLGTIVDVADAQRLLTQAQIDDALARLSVWRAMLGVAAAAGDIQPFLKDASQ